MFRDGSSHLAAARFISVTEKSLGIPAIRERPFLSSREGMAEIRNLYSLLAPSLCQAGLFHVDEICCLNRAAQALKKLFPAAIQHRGARD
jgi:hypothetical protein